MNPDEPTAQDPQPLAPEPLVTDSSENEPTKSHGFKNIFVLASFACLVVVIVASLAGWVKLNVSLDKTLTDEFALTAKRNTVVICSLLMTAVLAGTAYLRLRWLVIANFLLTAFAALIVFNQRLASSDAEIAKNTSWWLVCLLALVLNLAATAGVLATVRKPNVTPVSA